MGQTRKSLKTPYPQTVALIGMMGVGKTTVGRRLAPRLGLPFYDADAEIEAAAGMTTSELFAQHGEPSFREGEAKVIKRLLEGPPIVLATGGGAVIADATRALLRQHAITIWLRADIKTLVERTGKRDTRPLLRDGDPTTTIATLLKAREQYYRESDFHIESGPGPHDLTIDAIIDRLITFQDQKPQSDPSQ